MAGGFAVGGPVTRNTLARMEDQHVNHQIGVYFPWDSPHRDCRAVVAASRSASSFKAVGTARLPVSPTGSPARTPMGLTGAPRLSLRSTRRS